MVILTTEVKDGVTYLGIRKKEIFYTYSDQEMLNLITKLVNSLKNRLVRREIRLEETISRYALPIGLYLKEMFHAKPFIYDRERNEYREL